MDRQTNTPEDWRILAERDISIADYLAVNMTPVPTEIIAFHCQQATEKYLKGALVILGEERRIRAAKSCHITRLSLGYCSLI